MKDNFSIHSDQYAKYRPVYPQKLYEFLLKLVPDNKLAWDCATGNGQIANELTKYFDAVYATDISSKQLENAPVNSKITYSVSPAEQTSFTENSFDLITVGQAIHWFNFELFYKEAVRTIKNKGILAVVGYGLNSSYPEADAIISHFYHHIIGSFWDNERRYIDENYQTIPFPFTEIEPIYVENKMEWTFEQMMGYLGTWSAVQHYIKQRGENPLDLIYEKLKNTWEKKPTRTIRFPILLRVARIKK
jgi:ubiquinone/menaquinone biosynthesis C-methylase UbiE